MAFTESDCSFENIACDIVSNKQIETCESYDMNQNRITEFTKRCRKNKITLYCRKCDPDFACPDEFKMNRHELPPLIITDGYIYKEEKI